MAVLTEHELNVGGMTCDSCAHHVEAALRRVQGVVGAEVPSWDSARARVRAEEGVGTEELLQAVERAGYRAEVPNAAQPEEVRPGRPTARDDVPLPDSGGGDQAGGAVLRQRPGHAFVLRRMKSLQRDEESKRI